MSAQNEDLTHQFWLRAKDTAWPYRKTTDDITQSSFYNLYKLYQSNNWLNNAPYIVWDDWDISLEEGNGSWHDGLNVITDTETLHSVGLTYLCANIIKKLHSNFKGLSLFSYRLPNYKQILVFKKCNKWSVETSPLQDNVIEISVPTPEISYIEFSETACQVQHSFPIVSTRDKLQKRYLNSNIDVINNSIKDYHDALLVNTDFQNATNQLLTTLGIDKADIIECEYILLLTSLWLTFAPQSVNKAIYIPGIGFKEGETREECAGGIYFWATDKTTYDLKALQISESFRCLRASVFDRANKVEDLAKRSAKAAIMSRNFSHNVGSHALANPKLFESIGITAQAQKGRLGTFHSYAQGRLDFMARAMSPAEERPEPMFLVGEVLNGFFRQGVLLNTLVEDTGFPAQRMKFVVKLPDPANQDKFNTVEFSWKNDENPTDGTNNYYYNTNDEINDVLVGIPGGQIGCHALYAFFENCLRNAVKYGADAHDLRRSRDPLTLTITIGKCKPENSKNPKNNAPWVLRISDNISTDHNMLITNKIRTHINRSILGEGHEVTSEGHGIQEMKVCAEILAGKKGNNNWFPPDPVDGISHCEDCIKCSRFESEYARYIDHVKGINLVKIEKAQALRCYSRPELNGKPLLNYNLTLPNPILLGIVNLSGDDFLTNCLPDYIKVFSLNEMAHSGAVFGTVLDFNNVDLNCILSILENISDLHTALPYRLMIFTTDSNKTVWLDELNKYCNRHEKDRRIPQRRLHIVANNELIKSFQQNKSAGTYLGSQGWEATILKVYDAWLRSFKRPIDENSWKLCIAFQRNPEQIFGTEDVPKTWQTRVDGFCSDTDNPCISLYVKAVEPKEDEPKSKSIASTNWKLDSAGEILSPNNIPLNQLLIFDNHGKALNSSGNLINFLPDSARFYQEFGANSLNLYQSLESPPAQPFGFAYFIYGLAEAALTRIAVLDERVAQSTIKDKRLLDGGELPMQLAGILPLFCYKNTNDKALKADVLEHGLLSQTLVQGKRSMFINLAKKNPERYLEILEREGLIISDDSAIIRYAYQKSKHYHEVSNHDDQQIDIFVIHEGVTDMVEAQGRWNADKDIWKIYDSVPVIVRTSGRGSVSRHLKNFLPFVEFTELSENTYRSLNKYALAKAFLGALGHAIKR